MLQTGCRTLLTNKSCTAVAVDAKFMKDSTCHIHQSQNNFTRQYKGFNSFTQT